ncbi:MAG TPA: MauE/DoxX family redox-associated membrane protein [Blastocatellia bacterium]|nr:MauE/DoxX family redox-associated membrane protein [Blastocatellia bacterium]
MEVILLLARLVLFFVFGVAGISKLADREGSRRALTGFGVPDALTTPLAWLLPVAEILVAVALIPLSTAWLGGVGALVLLVAFLVGIGVNLARGQSPDCHCFGQLHSEPVSWKVFVRNVVLAGIAALLVVQGQDRVGLSATEWMNEMRTGEVISLLFGLVAVAVLIPIFVMLRRALKQQAAMLETVTAMKKLIEEDYPEPLPIEREDAAPPVEGLPVGAPAPAFSFATLEGTQMSLDDLLARGKSVLLFFVSPNCSPCKTLLPHIRVWQRDYSDFITIALLSKGAEKDVHRKMAKYEVGPILLHGESPIADEYQAKWTPAAVLVDRSGKIASPVTYGDEAIRSLVTHTVATADAANQTAGIPRPQIKVGKSLFNVGEPAPRVALPALDGKEVALDSFLGEATLLLFWNPGCGYCKAMADDLIRWEAKPNATRLVFVSAGEAAELKTESERFRSVFLHDADSDIAAMFGANGTPSAVLLDETGRIASSLAVGEQNILALLGVRKVTLPLAKGQVNGKPVQTADTAAEIVTR